MTSCIESPRSAEARVSPSTQRTASITFDLPQPFGPTTPTSWPGTWIAVGSTKDLKPESFICVRRIAENDNIRSLDAIAPKQAAGDVSEPCSRARLPHPHGDPGVHLRLPDDRAAGLRHARARVRSRSPLRGAEVAQAVHLVLSRRRHVPRGGDQPHPR